MQIIYFKESELKAILLSSSTISTYALCNKICCFKSLKVIFIDKDCYLHTLWKESIIVVIKKNQSHRVLDVEGTFEITYKYHFNNEKTEVQ